MIVPPCIAEGPETEPRETSWFSYRCAFQQFGHLPARRSLQPHPPSGAGWNASLRSCPHGGHQRQAKRQYRIGVAKSQDFRREQRFNHWLLPATVDSGAVGVPRLDRRLYTGDLQIGELKLLGRNRERGVQV